MAVIILKFTGSGQVDVETACRLSSSSHLWKGGKMIDVRNPPRHRKRLTGARVTFLSLLPDPHPLFLTRLREPLLPPPPAPNSGDGSFRPPSPPTNVHSDDVLEYPDTSFFEDSQDPYD
jgi:hypothetical protein